MTITRPDEPANGLDPEGVRWLRDLLRGLASTATSRRVGGFSLGMGQRLALATTLVCDPGILILARRVQA